MLDRDDKNWVTSFEKKELEKIAQLAIQRSKIAEMKDSARIRFVAEIAVGKVKDFCYNLTVIGRGAKTDDDELILHLKEGEEELGFLQDLCNDILVKRRVWRKALTDAINAKE